MMNLLHSLNQLGQRVWLDDIRRNYLIDGTFKKLITEDGVSGLTSNPAIFKHAITTASEYEESIINLVKLGKNAEEIYETLIVEDIQLAADILRPIYDRTNMRDGYVSMEVSPLFAYDTEATIIDAQRLWSSVKRPNLIIKIPATEPGLKAIERLVSEGLNINVTLLFGLSRYEQVIDAYWKGLEARLDDANDVHTQFCVASFFISRIDSLIDSQLQKHKNNSALKFQGKVAIACAQLAYKTYQASLKEKRWYMLAQHDANTQKLLWASTSTKNPNYSNLKYVEALIAPDTINTLPLDTLKYCRESLNPSYSMTCTINHPEHVISELKSLGINIEEVTKQLEQEGVSKFKEPYDELIKWLNKRRNQILMVKI